MTILLVFFSISVSDTLSHKGHILVSLVSVVFINACVLFRFTEQFSSGYLYHIFF